MTAQPSTETALDLYRAMARIRAFETEVRRLHMGGRIPGLVHLYIGQEAVAAGVCAALARTDLIASHHRGHGHCVAKGGDLERLFAELMGRRTGYGRGRGGSLHIYDPDNGNLGTNGIVGGGVPLAVGAALSAKLRGDGRVAVCFFGDGALNQGLVFECLNMAALWALPVVFVCENNRYGEYTAIEDAAAGSDLKARATVFGIPAHDIDGMDVLAVYAAAAEAVARARASQGPSFLMCETYRFGGHHVGDKQSYKSEEQRRMWQARDPLNRLKESLGTSDEVVAEIDRAAQAAVRDSAQRALSAPMPDLADLAGDIYAG